MKRPEVERFMEKVDTTDGCWLWTAATFRDGYGQFYTPTGERSAHRWAYSYFIGPIPAGLVIDHLCRVRRCVKPSHLEVVTNEENLRRGFGFKVANGLDPHCPHGHEYTPENTIRTRRGSVQCRACARDRDRQRDSGWARQRSAAGETA